MCIPCQSKCSSILVGLLYIIVRFGVYIPRRSVFASWTVSGQFHQSQVKRYQVVSNRRYCIHLVQGLRTSQIQEYANLMFRVRELYFSQYLTKKYFPVPAVVERRHPSPTFLRLELAHRHGTPASLFLRPRALCARSFKILHRVLSKRLPKEIEHT